MKKNKVNYSGNSGNWESDQPIRGTVLRRDEGLHGSFKAQACLSFLVQSSHTHTETLSDFTFYIANHKIA